MIGENNPFNVRPCGIIKWNGLTGCTRGYCNFDTIEHGIRVAAYLVIRSYFRYNVKSYKAIIYRFAPPSENDSQKYLQFVLSFVKKRGDEEPVNIQQFVRLLRAMSIYEGNPVSTILIDNVIQKYKRELFVHRLKEIQYSPTDY